MILIFLWFFQITFLNNFYEINQRKLLNTSIIKLSKSYYQENYQELFDNLANEDQFCIELVREYETKYVSKISKNCVNENSQNYNDVKINFINSNKKTDNIEIINPNYNNKILVIAKKLDDNNYLFVNTSLEPLDYSISLLKNQFIYVALIVFGLSSLISYFIAKSLTKPIIKLNENVKELKKNNYDIVFDENTGVEELNELSQNLNLTTKELAKTQELRRELMANVSHDLKTPLTMIKAYAEAARDLNYNNKEKQTENLNIIIEETERLNILVNDILDLSKLESNIEKFEKETINITELIESIIKRFDIYKDKYQFQFNKIENTYIKADKKRIEQVIYNLIINAINYTGEDKRIYINMKKLETSEIRIEVQDFGPGIEKKDINLIWDKYFKIDKKYKRNKVGTGLGLSIVKNILVGHNFKYGVESKKNKGTTFYFIAPIIKKEN